MTVPPEELINKSYMTFACNADNIVKIYDIERFRGRSYIFLLHVTARVINACHSKSFKELFTDIIASDIVNAEKLCIEASMY